MYDTPFRVALEAVYPSAPDRGSARWQISFPESAELPELRNFFVHRAFPFWPLRLFLGLSKIAWLTCGLGAHQREDARNMCLIQLHLLSRVAKALVVNPGHLTQLSSSRHRAGNLLLRHAR